MSQVATQHQFLTMLARLVLYADSIGLRVTGGDLYRDPRAFQDGLPYGHPDSYHKRRLAIDLNLFTNSGGGQWDYRTTRDDYLPLGEYWEAMGGTWGGNFTVVDAPHFSLGEPR